MKSIAFHNLGCKVNGYEMDFMQQTLQDKGYHIVPFDEKADIYIINTCTVTNIADRKSRQMIHRARKANPEAVVVAVGCYVQAGKENVLRDEGIDLAIGNNRKKDLLPLLEEYLAAGKRKGTGDCGAADKTLQGTTIIDIAHTEEYESMKLTRTAEHTRAFIKVQDGCDQFCSYCIIPYARGRVRSRDMEDALEEIRGLAEKGYQEVVLTGIHLSSYGMTGGNDFTQSRLPGLIEAVEQIPEIKRIRLGSLEPRIITDRFAAELKGAAKLCPHFHLSLQSGCNETLKRMNRKYSAEEYYEKVCILRENFRDPALTTDVIVGFPGETQDEFEKTEAFLAKTGFYEMHVFKYSRRAGTKASLMKDQISEELKTVRSKILLELGDKMSCEYRERHLHSRAEVLFEEAKEIDGRQYYLGFTKEYIRAAYEIQEGAAQEKISGRIMTGELTEFLKSDILLFGS